MAVDKKIPTSASGAVNDKIEDPTTVSRADSSFTDVDRNGRRFRGFLSKKITPRDLYEATVTVKPLSPHMIPVEIAAGLQASCIRAMPGIVKEKYLTLTRGQLYDEF
jgi:hypothetical protein